MSNRNRLSEETSPYLLQHADNPVHWQPWDAAALEHARREDLPILLSVGYSACHWCHVMAHESFEDADIADLMNGLFVNIKVDREERPDLDRVYQTMHQVLNRQSGGWPLTALLDPETHMPFFSGTYFPPEGGYGRPGFPDLLRQAAAFFQQKRSSIRAQEAQLQPMLEHLQTAKAAEAPPSPVLIGKAIENLRLAYQPEWGGFMAAPKFPMPAMLEFMLSASGSADRDMALHTLQRIAEGGLFDHLQGGFYRYATDEQWQIPHFEKMLYDNGSLLAVFARAFTISGRGCFREVASRTAQWAIATMRLESGAFCASVDADSEGEEGRYYLWSRDEVSELISGADFEHFTDCYGLNREPNFEGRWHLRRSPDADWEAPGSDLEKSLQNSRAALLQARAQRVPPGRDDKVLVSWNSLLIRGLALAGRIFDEPRYLDVAEQALGFIEKEMWCDGRLRATWNRGQARFNACLDDYAFLLQAELELLQSRWNADRLIFCQSLADVLLDQFQGAEGGFHFTSHDHEELLYRPMEMQDDAMPSGNGIAAASLITLGHLIGESRYIEAAEKTLRVAGAALAANPEAHCSLLRALDALQNPAAMLLMHTDADTAREWMGVSREQLPDAMIYLLETDDPRLPAHLREIASRPGPVALACAGDRCLAPAASLTQLEERLRELQGAGQKN